MTQPGKTNTITDVTGILVGHHTDREHMSGTTAVVCPGGAVAGVDVRGSAPGTRETDLLEPWNLVEKVNAVLLCGGSVYGLAASHGAVSWLAQRGWGFPLEQDHVAPIVPAAALFDLGRGPDYVPPVKPEWGSLACEAANDGSVALGCAGAGAGAVAGGIKGGMGSASQVLESGLTVAALMAVNSLGSLIDPATGLLWEARLLGPQEGGDKADRAVVLPEPPEGQPGRNTTIGVVATDAVLTKAQATKLAQMAQDGLARAIRPAHTMFDGATIFCLATGANELPDTPGFFAAPKAAAVNELGQAMADCVSRAIMRAVLAAESLGEFTAWADMEDL